MSAAVERPETVRLRVAADIGGTFTDVAFIGEDGVVTTRKVPSTPDDYARAVVEGITALIAEWGLQPDDVGEVLHGCTVATNAILEGKGAKTALVTTKGFRDVLELRRIRMPRLYEPLYVKPTPLVPRHRRFEVAERLAADGSVVVPLDRDDVMAAVRGIRESGAEAVAVAFLNAYADGRHERIAGDMLRRELPDRFISLSVDVLPEIREYERTSTTVINAYLGPPVKAYVDSLVNRLDEAGLKSRLLIMQSSGGMLDAATVMDKPVQIVECGPAAGVIGSLHLGRLIGRENLITLDMGGTTAKASLIENGRLLRTDEYEVGGGISLSSRLVKGGGYALKTPVIDISEVGAGGGSIVWFDRVGQLKVGPQSAGAVPGPACYQGGGEAPTVTDANVVLGYVNPTAIAGGTVPIHADAAHRAIEEKIARPLGRDVLEIAHGIHVIASANMMRAVKAVSTYRGRDPRDFVLMAFGGSGGIHAAELARALQIERVVVPLSAGVFSALGLLFSDIQLTQSQGFLRAIGDIRPDDMNDAYAGLERDIVARLGYPRERVTLSRFADLRYAGQAYELTVPVPGGRLRAEAVATLAEAFEAEHEATYGHRYPGEKPVQAVGLRVTGAVEPEGRRGIDARRAGLAGGPAGEAEGARPAYFGPDHGTIETPVLSRRALGAGAREGPLVIEEYEGTVVVPPAARASLDAWGNIDIEIDTDITAPRS